MNSWLQMMLFHLCFFLMHLMLNHECKCVHVHNNLVLKSSTLFIVFQVNIVIIGVMLHQQPHTMLQETDNQKGVIDCKNINLGI